MRQAWINGKIYLERGTFCQALLVEDGVIVKTGSDEEIGALAGTSPAVDCRGKTLVPGLNDSHLHLSCFGASLMEVDLTRATSIDEIVSLCRDHMTRHPERTRRGMRSMGWNQDLFEGDRRLPDRDDLDRISTEIPIVLERVCGHICATNSKVLEILGIDEKTASPEGGTIERDRSGRPRGIFTENAVAWVEGTVPPLPVESRMELFEKAMDYAASCGLTSLQSNDVGAPNACGDFLSIRRLYEEGRAKIRFRHQVTCQTAEEIERLVATERSHPAYGGDRLTFGPLKLFKDGSLGARTALMRQAYRDDPGNFGVEALSDSLQETLCRKAAQCGLQVITHVIGDRAIEKTLDIYEKIMKEGKNDLRHGLVHCQITDRALLERIARLGVVVFYQPIFLDYDMHIVEDRCGRELARTSYAFASLDALGAPIGYGTDAPVEDLNPFPNICEAVTRQDRSGYPEGGFHPQERVDVCTALDAYTTGSAYCEFMEHRKGRIREGYLADFTLLSEDIFSIAPERIRDIKALMTVVGGETVHRDTSF